MLTNIYLFLARIPQKCGCGEYKPGVKYFLCRQAFHLLGAVAVGGLALLLSKLFDNPVYRNGVAAIVGGIMFGVIAFGEADDVKNGQAPYKTMMDIVVWAFGFAVPVIFI